MSLVSSIFALSLAAIVAVILAIEGDEHLRSRLKSPTGLLTWIIRGNWPAKVGAFLMIVGVGALLRYMLIHIDVAPSTKLSGGVLAAGILGFASLLTRRRPAQRAVSLALNGAAVGIAYLTAYSAFALFGYLSTPAGLGLLSLTAAVAGVFAVTRGALSLALLAMSGAYLAPAFAVSDPGPAVVLGYYTLASAMTLIMVALRGWRPLTHLSFIFTLAGSALFAWTAQYFTPAHLDAVAPFLLALTALHVAMPIVERGAARDTMHGRLDRLYFYLLPIASAALAHAIAPSTVAFSTLLFALSAAWLTASTYLYWHARRGAVHHIIVACLLIVVGLAIRFRNLPWDVLGLGAVTLAFAIAVRGSSSRSLHDLFAGLVILFGGAHMIIALDAGAPGAPFLNTALLERLTAAFLLVFASRASRRAGQSLDRALLTAGIGWATLTIVVEVIRWNVLPAVLLTHWTLLAAALVVSGWRSQRTERLATMLAIAILITSDFAAEVATPSILSWSTLLMACAALGALALRRSSEDDDDGDSSRLVAALTAPVVAGIWSYHLVSATTLPAGYFIFCVSTAVALIILTAAAFTSLRDRPLIKGLAIATAAILGVALAAFVLVDIHRSGTAVTAELLCLGGLLMVSLLHPSAAGGRAWVQAAVLLGAALTLQANLLRWLGPAGDLALDDLWQMRWPSLISLLWAVVGAAATIWARRSLSRSTWIGGATLLIAAATKFILVDFGRLGDIGNILAVIAGGAVFLLVGWLAPMPPRRSDGSEGVRT